MSVDSVPVHVVVRDESNLRDAYGGVRGAMLLSGTWLRPRARADARHAISVFMHPVRAATRRGGGVRGALLARCGVRGVAV